ncbi:acyl-CoA dehydrogenase family protein [Myxococcota bacterium]|nr:acyl-CoA dehydrogenase family protein [Myxococcota bacterium]
MIGNAPPLPELAQAFQSWLDEKRDEHARFKQLPHDFGGKVELLGQLQRELFDAGWTLYGWSEKTGGRGGTVLHRGLIVDLLEINGYPPRHHFEHLDILPPALERYASPELIGELFLATLRGDTLWCQGFSEPTSGSDLASLRTRAQAVDGGYRIDGHKIWTSWAKWATHCLFLARTGTTEDRHRGLTAFVVDLTTPGLTVGPIPQPTGEEELAEVFFDGVVVPESNRVGAEGEGWAVAMHILAGERGNYAWLRQCEILPRLERLAATPNASEHTELLGDCLVRLLALRCRSRAVMEILARGEAPGPESSVTKVMVIDTEQYFYEAAREVLSPELDLGSCENAQTWQDDYLYSRASSIYGGSRQIQLNVIARLMVEGNRAAPAGEADEELEVVRQSVGDALEKTEQTREALDGLDWFAFAASPEDAFGRTAFGAWFEGLGSRVRTSPALAAVANAAVAETLKVDAASLAYAISPPSAGDDPFLLVCGLDADTTHLVIHDAGNEVRVLAADAVEAAPSYAMDSDLISGVRIVGTDEQRIELDADAAARALTLARIAASFDMLGASRALLETSSAHTQEREQFGQPIARFQAIQHLVAESVVDVSALSEMCRSTLEQWSDGDAVELAMAVKALAGRTGRAVAQRALQCFGAIGFTEEHVHHRFSRRIHTLDALLGSRQALHRQLGADLVRTGHAPRGIQIWRPDDVSA